MKGVFKQTIWFIFFFLVVANVFLFINGMRLSADINGFESQITLLHKQNVELEKKAYQIESLTYAASMAAQLQYTKKSAPVYMDNHTVAKNGSVYDKN